MTINYTTLLGLAQPVTGTEQGTWGDTVNTEITALLEDAIADAATFSVTSGDVTLTSTAGQANQARMAILLVTGTPGVSRNIIAPSQSKWYIVKNSSDASVVLKGSATTGVTILAGTEALCFWNGSDFEIVGVNGPSSSTDNAVVRFDGTTGKVIQNSGVIIDDSNNVSGMGTLGVGAITTTGVFTATAGTVSAPAITTTGDTNTGIFFPAADTIAFTEGGAEAMRIDSSGNVIAVSGSMCLVGTNTQIYAASNGDDVQFKFSNVLKAAINNQGIISAGDGSNATPGFRFLDDSNTGFTRPTTDTIGFVTGGGERMRIDSSGNVGIGTSSPASFGALCTRRGISVSNVTGSVSASFSDGANDTFYVSQDSSLSRLTFSTLAFNTGTTERMRINSSGNVIVGATSTPYTSRFAIFGAKGATAGLPTNQLQVFDTTAQAADVGGAISFGGYFNSTDYTGWASIAGNKENNTSGNYAGYLGFYTRPNGGSNTERMRIDSSGNVTYAIQPSFQVENIASQLAVGNVVPWSTVIANRGSHYSTVNNRFTAPVTGYYQFNVSAFTVRTTNTGDCYWDLRVNATLQFRIYQAKTGTTNDHQQAMGSVILSLAANDYVDVYYHVSPGNVNMETGASHNMFSGFLLG